MFTAGTLTLEQFEKLYGNEFFYPYLYICASEKQKEIILRSLRQQSPIGVHQIFFKHLTDPNQVAVHLTSSVEIVRQAAKIQYLHLTEK